MKALDFAISNWDTISTVGVLLGGWLWHKARHEKTESLQEMLLKLGRQALPVLVKDARLYDDAYVNGQIRKAIVAGLGRINVKITPATSALVDLAVEHVHDELASQLTEAHLGEFVKVQSKTLAELQAASS